MGGKHGMQHIFSRLHGLIHLGAHMQLACLAQVQGLATKSAWESSGGPEQDTDTDRQRRRIREGDCRVQIKFHCLFA